MSADQVTKPSPTAVQLEAQGFERRAVASGERLEEQANCYRELGLEVVLIQAPKDPESGCGECFGLSRSFIIYTRKPANH